jgi:hypothetical protein
MITYLKKEGLFDPASFAGQLQQITEDMKGHQ